MRPRVLPNVRFGGRIHEALRKEPEDRRVRAVAECVRRFPRETLRHPEVYLYLEHLARRDNTAALARILGDRPRRGRPSRSADEELTEVAIIAGIIKREGCSANRAAAIARREHPTIFGHRGERDIANAYSRLRDAYRLAIEPRWLPSSKVTDYPWSRSSDSRNRR
jgi:hypothetical protein